MVVPLVHSSHCILIIVCKIIALLSLGHSFTLLSTQSQSFNFICVVQLNTTTHLYSFVKIFKIHAFTSVYYYFTVSYLPRLSTLWSSNMFSDRSSEISVVFTPTASHTSQRPSGPSSQNPSSSDVRTVFFLNIAPACVMITIKK